MELYDLKTLHQKKNMGIDRTPYFSWKISSDRQNVLQTAYQIVVSDEKETVWDSGKVEGHKQSFVEYEGEKLRAKTEYHWKVTAWNNYGEETCGESEFETAILDESQWKAKWVESSIRRVTAAGYKYGNTAPAVFFERKFSLKRKRKVS